MERSVKMDVWVHIKRDAASSGAPLAPHSELHWCSELRQRTVDWWSMRLRFHRRAQAEDRRVFY
jgi:hypothetical protein